MTLPGTAGTVSFKYDPFGRRIQKVLGSATTNYVYDGDSIVEELNASGVATTRYTQGLGIDEPLALTRAGATYYYEADGLGSITTLTDSTGAPAAGYVYDSFGNATVVPGSIPNPYRYTAREFDSETALYYYRARYYDTTEGRFLNEDPIGFNGGFNFYSYAGNSPANFVDPSGQVIGVKGDYSAWMTALLYLSGSSTAYRTIKDLEESPDLYIVNVSDTYAKDQAVDGKTVFWNPHRALCVKHGVQSPAIGLLHELDHIWQHRHRKTGNLEEAAVQMTNPASMQLGEPTRINYHDARGQSMDILPIPSFASEKCKCQEPNK